MKDMLYSVDFISKDIELNLKGRKRVSSALGISVSLLLVCLFIALTIFFGEELVTRSNPKSRFDIRNMEDTKIALKDYPVAFSVFGGQERDMLIDEKFLTSFEITPLLFVLDSNRSNAIFSGKIFECTEEITNPTFFNKLSKLKPHLKKMCVDSSTFYNFFTQQPADVEKVIDKPFGYDESSTLTISINSCSKRRPGCKDYEGSTNGIYVVVYSENSFVDVSNYENPLGYDLAQSTYGMGNGLFSRHYVSVQKNLLITDSGWVFESNSSISWFAVGEKRIEITEYDPITRGVFGVSFTGPTREQIYHRQYLKLQQLLANLGGFFKALLIIGRFIVGFYSDFIVYNVVSDALENEERIAIQNDPSRAENVVIRNDQDRKEQINNSITNLRNYSKRPKPSFIQFILSKISSSVRTKHKIDKSLVKQSLDVSGLICLNQRGRRENIREPI